MNFKQLKKSSDLFALSNGIFVTKKELYQLIQYSKKIESDFWDGEEWIINNTPQQGINWIGMHPNLKAVLVKTRNGSYEEDGWLDNTKQKYRYSYKARQGKVNLNDNANRALSNQPIGNYPIILFIEIKDIWEFQGYYKVSEIEKKSVILTKLKNLQELNTIENTENDIKPSISEVYLEGERKYSKHLLSERNTKIIKEIKATKLWTCEICKLKFIEKYNKEYIEAHHKIPISSYDTPHQVTIEDFALLCPNCHKAVHLYLKDEGLEFEEAKNKINNLNTIK